MSDINPEFIERYQLLYEKDPHSKVFAPLAEAYRKIGLTNKAYLLCIDGVKKHPDFAGGRIALARCLVELKELEKAAEQLLKATELSPENILAFSLLADLMTKLRKPKEALKAFKMVLFLNPDNRKAQKAVKKLESLTADEFEDEVFQMHSLKDLDFQEPEAEAPKQKLKIDPFERYVSLIDAFIVRNELDQALERLEEAEKELGEHPELQRRFQIINKQRAKSTEGEQLSPMKIEKTEAIDEKIKTLRDFLYNINANSKQY